MSLGDTSIIISIFTLLCSIIGIIISYKQLRLEIKREVQKTDLMISSIMQSQTQGNTFNNCKITYTGNVKDKKTINNEFTKNEQ